MRGQQYLNHHMNDGNRRPIEAGACFFRFEICRLWHEANAVFGIGQAQGCGAVRMQCQAQG